MEAWHRCNRGSQCSCGSCDGSILFRCSYEESLQECVYADYLGKEHAACWWTIQCVCNVASIVYNLARIAYVVLCMSIGGCVRINRGLGCP